MLYLSQKEREYLNHAWAIDDSFVIDPVVGVLSLKSTNLYNVVAP